MTMLNCWAADTDSYKLSQPFQYPNGAEAMHDYIEAREGSEFNEIKFFLLQYGLKVMIENPLTHKQVDRIKALAEAHGEPFAEAGYRKIVDVYGGLPPVTIRAVPEGMIIPKSNVLVTVDGNDPDCFWIASSIETMIQRVVWYGSTVATLSYQAKKYIRSYLEMTSDDPEGQLPFKLHDFGSRGVSSRESAGTGGLAHLTNFLGTDTVMALIYGQEYYNCDMAGFSIPASEHSTITSWGRENEAEAYRNMLTVFGKEGALLACVSDSYDIYNACENLWGGELLKEVIDSGATLVVRPDSGYPPEVALKCIDILGERFGYTTNGKGYKVLNYVRVIYGDGMDLDMIAKVCYKLKMAGWSIDNIAFGMGGGLLQKLNRDTCSFAMKCSAIKVNGEWRDVYKDPATQDGNCFKGSKRGRLSLYRLGNGKFITIPIEKGNELMEIGDDYPIEEVLQTVYENGRLVKEWTLDEVRANECL